MSDEQRDTSKPRDLFGLIVDTPLPTILVILGAIAVFLGFADIRKTGVIIIGGGRPLLAGIGGILVVTGILMFLKPSRYWVLWLLPFVIGGLLFLAVTLIVDGPPNRECLDNLLEPNCSILLPIFDDNGQITARMVSENLEIAFSNGQGYTGVVFQFTSALDVQQVTHVDISGTATRDFKLTIEYKIREGNTAKVVKSSEFHSFPAAIGGVSTIQIPLTFAGKVDEIALMFYVPGEASEVTIGSIRLSE